MAPATGTAWAMSLSDITMPKRPAALLMSRLMVRWLTPSRVAQ